MPNWFSIGCGWLRPIKGPWLSNLRANLGMTLIVTPAMTSAMTPASALTSGVGSWYVPWLNLSISLLRTSAVSSTLWWATLRASLYDSLLLNLGSHSILDLRPSLVVAGYPCLCSWLVKEEKILQITLPLHWAPQGRRPGDLSRNRHYGKCPDLLVRGLVSH